MSSLASLACLNPSQRCCMKFIQPKLVFSSLLLCYFSYIVCFYVCKSSINFNLNVPPTSSPPCQAFMRSEFKPQVKNLQIELVSILKLFFCFMCLSVLVLSSIDIYYGFSSRSSLTYRNLILTLLFLSYITIFDYYFLFAHHYIKRRQFKQ